MSDSYEDYFSYLKQRSRLGYLYRQFWLYPTICRYLSGKVLDIGTGIGDLLRFRQNTIGVDVNPETVKYCQAQGFDARLMEIDRLPFDSSSFDGVVLDNVLEHIENPVQLLKEINRVLTDGKIFIVGVPGALGYASDTDHKVFYSKEKMIDTITEMGFYTQKTFSMPIDLDWLGKKLRQFCVYGVFIKI